MFDDDPTVPPDRAAELVARLRANAGLVAAAQAEQLRLVAQLADVVATDAVAVLAQGPRVSGAPPEEEVIESAVEGEIQAVLGIGPRPAATLVDLAHASRSCCRRC